MDDSIKNIFSTLTSKATSVFGGENEDMVVGVDIGSSAIKVVELKKKKGKAMLETYGAISLGPYAQGEIGQVVNMPAEKIVEALKEVLKASETSSVSSAMAIPVQSSLVFGLSLPARLTESEMKSVIPTEARKYIPVPINEVALDYFVLPTKEPSFVESNNPEIVSNDEIKKDILVVAIQNDAISRYRSVSTQCDLKSSFFELEIFSSIRSNFEHELSLVLLIDFGASRTKLSLVEFGTIKAYHTINRGGAEITDSISKSLSMPFAKAEELKKEFGVLENPSEKSIPDIIKTHLDYIFSEANTVLLNYEKKYGQTITKVILTGGGASMKGLPEIAMGNFKTEVQVGKPFSKVGSPAFLEKVLLATGPEFAVAIGLALRKLQ